VIFKSTGVVSRRGEDDDEEEDDTAAQKAAMKAFLTKGSSKTDSAPSNTVHRFFSERHMADVIDF
jgi:hypothetical protein